MWQRMARSYTTLMNAYVPWCVWLSRKGFANDDYLFATMHHWDEFIVFLARKKLEGVTL